MVKQSRCVGPDVMRRARCSVMHSVMWCDAGKMQSKDEVIMKALFEKQALIDELTTISSASNVSLPNVRSCLGLFVLSFPYNFTSIQCVHG